MIDLKQFHEQGYLIVKDLFTTEEIGQFRKQAYTQFQEDEAGNLTFSVPNSKARYAKGDLLTKQHLSHIILDDRILNIAKTILENNPVYFGDSSYQIGVGLRGYHRDNVDRKFNEGPDWDGDYSIIRFGLYMQDHSKFSGGLKVQVGTHKAATGKSVFVDIEPGDLVVWNLRLLHSGNAVRLKFLSSQPVDFGEHMIPDFLKKDEQLERIACFFSYGNKGKHLDRYFNNYLLKTPLLATNLKNWQVNENIVVKAKLKNLQIINPATDPCRPL